MEKLGQLVNASLAARMVLVGYEHDIFGAMCEPITVADLALKVNCDARYLREWCEGLHLSGYVECDKLSDPVRFSTNEQMAAALVEMKPILHLVKSLTCDTVYEQYRTSFKTGASIDYNAYPNVGALIGQLLLAFYADKLPQVLHDLPVTRDLINKEIKIADMGCGEGRSTHSLAGIFERADVVGFDLDHDSIVFAQSNNSNPRVTFIEKNMFDIDQSEQYDVVCFFLCLHDMTWPSKALKSAAKMLRPNGLILVAESPAAATFNEATPAEATGVCISSLHCLPVSRQSRRDELDPPPEDIGNPFRLGQLKQCVDQAGLSSCEKYSHASLDTMSLYVIQ